MLGVPAPPRAAGGLERAEPTAGRRLVRGDRAALRAFRRIRFSRHLCRRRRLFRLVRGRQSGVVGRRHGPGALEHAHGRARAAAPTIWQDKVYFGSDDGFVYCLRAGDGGEQWKFHAAPDEGKVLGSGKMISLWPVRTGVLVDDGTAVHRRRHFPGRRCGHVRRQRGGRQADVAAMTPVANRPRAGCRRKVTCWPRKTACSLRWAACRRRRSTARRTPAVRGLCRAHHRRHPCHAGRQPGVHRDRTDDRLRPGELPCEFQLVLGP